MFTTEESLQILNKPRRVVPSVSSSASSKSGSSRMRSLSIKGLGVTLTVAADKEAINFDRATYVGEVCSHWPGIEEREELASRLIQ